MTRQVCNLELLDRLPPQDLGAEKGVLGSCLLDAERCDEVRSIVQAEDFYDARNRMLFDHLLKMRAESQPLDPVILSNRLVQAGDLEAVGGTAYLAEVVQSVPYARNATFYSRIVRQKAILRKLIQAGLDTVQEAYNTTADADEVVAEAERRIFAVREAQAADSLTTMQSALVEVLDHLDELAERKGHIGVPTGFWKLDDLIGGLYPGELTILAARPSIGKTALATNIVAYVAIESKIPTLFVSLEMSRRELAQRMLAGRCGIDGNRFRNGDLSPDDRKAVVQGSGELATDTLTFDDTPSRSISDVAAVARRVKHKGGLGLLVIDYLQLIQPDNSKDPRQEQVAKMARRLKELSRELQVPVLCLAQFNRQVEAGKGDHRPRLSHLRESGAIEQDSDVVLGLHREEVYRPRDEELRGQAELLILKNRNGPTGEIKLHWDAATTTFSDGPVVTEWEPGQDYGEAIEAGQRQANLEF